MPEIEFVNSPKTEEERRKFTAKVIGQGFYRRHGFVVVPELDWRAPHNIQVIYPKEFKYQKLEVGRVAQDWKQVEKYFWQEMARYFAGLEREHGKIEVRITRYGTTASGAALVDHRRGKLVYYLRDDADISNLAGIIINKILFGERRGLGITWTKREALMDFIMTRPAMKKLFPQFRPVFAELSRVSARVRRESEAYVRSLGIETAADIEVVRGKILITGGAVASELTKKEKVALTLLVRRRGDLVTYDELADSIWGEGEFKTYWAINKIVGRMRPKLLKLGLNTKIESVRGQGYILQ